MIKIIDTPADLMSLSHIKGVVSASPEKYPNKFFRDKECKWCGKVFTPRGPSHHYCSLRCCKDNRAKRRLQVVYGVDADAAIEALNNQGGLCKICNTTGFKMHKHKKHGLSLDHCHKTGLVRGWLCDNCNRGLGLFQDKIEILEAAIEYLKSGAIESTAARTAEGVIQTSEDHPA